MCIMFMLCTPNNNKASVYSYCVCTTTNQQQRLVMEINDVDGNESDDVTVVEETSESSGSGSENAKVLPTLAPKPHPVMLRRSVAGQKLLPGRYLTGSNHPSFINAWRMLKKQEQLKRGPKEKDTFRRAMYCLPDKYAKLPKFSSADAGEKALVQEHQDLGFGYPAQDYDSNQIPRKTELCLSLSTQEFEKFLCEELYPNLKGKKFDIFRIDKQRRLIRLAKYTPRAIKDSKYQGSLIIIPYVNEEDRPPQVLYRCGEEYFMHQVTSTTSPHNQIPLIGTPPDLPISISEGSIDGTSPSFSPASSHSIQASSPKHLLIPKESSSPPPVMQQQLDLTNTVIKCETESIPSETISRSNSTDDMKAKCKIFEISKFLRMQIQDKSLIHIRRSNVLFDVLKLYQENSAMIQNDFTVCFEEHSHDDDVGHVPLSPHALFVQFWREAFEHFFAGNQESVPIVDVSTEPEFFKTLGQILYHGLILLDYWPVKLSQACACIMILNTCSDRQLLTSLHRTMSDQERSVITDAKREIRSGCSEFSMLTTKSLYQVLRLYGNTQRPRPGNLEQLLRQISNFHLKQKSYWALYEMRSGLQSTVSDFLSHLEEQDIFTFYSLLTPNALSLFEKTIYMFSATDNSINEMEEKRVKMYFENFVMKLNCETLSALLVKWSYSDCLCVDHLYVRFLPNSISDRPHFDPNKTTLALSSVYTSQEELHQLMMSELES
ncbi:uncharacterized protein LOC125676043 isoform X1 [Ostrea edulis]|uniref:uncharacterized protein LOC125676043 isoform X1 n=1 Tax=Ostrea edulis TaxID=37623 RepID=UPI0020960BF2|nr:uncharacterized protein LOC125676043 isoform X1 [Ostrea edulis]